jgi:hypothetical protein
VWDVVIFRILLQMSENRMAKIDGPMTFDYGIDATGSVCKINCAEQASASHAKGPAVIMMVDRLSPSAWKNLHGGKPLFDFAFRRCILFCMLGRGDNRGFLM